MYGTRLTASIGVAVTPASMAAVAVWSSRRNESILFGWLRRCGACNWLHATMATLGFPPTLAVQSSQALRSDLNHIIDFNTETTAVRKSKCTNAQAKWHKAFGLLRGQEHTTASLGILQHTVSKKPNANCTSVRERPPDEGGGRKHLAAMVPARTETTPTSMIFRHSKSDPKIVRLLASALKTTRGKRIKIKEPQTPYRTIT